MIHCLSPGIAVQTEALRRICFSDWEKTEFNSYFVLHIAEPIVGQHRAKAEKKMMMSGFLQWSTVLSGVMG